MFSSKVNVGPSAEQRATLTEWSRESISGSAHVDLKAQTDFER